MRHRPASIAPRRAARRALAAAAVALACAACAAEPAPETPWSEARMARLTLRQKVAQMVVAPARPAAGSLTDSATLQLRARVRAGLGGVLLTGGIARANAELAAVLGTHAAIPPLVVARLERGAGERFAGATELPDPGPLAAAGDRALAREAGAVAAAEARALGINLAIVPGPPLPAADRASVLMPPAPVADGALAAYFEGFSGAGLLAGVTAFRPSVPGVVGWDRATLDAVQLAPLRAAARAGAFALELGDAVVPALTGDSTPLPFSPVAGFGTVRRDLGFEGVMVADLDSAGPLGRRYGPARAAVAAVLGGADLLLAPSDPDAVIDSVVAAVEDGRVPRSRVDAAVRRVFAAKARAGLGLLPPSPPPSRFGTPPSASPADADSADAPAFRTEAAVATAERAFARTANVLGAAPETVLRGCRRTVLVTHPEALANPLSAALFARDPKLLHLKAAATPRRGPLSRVEGFAGNGADCVVAASFPGARLPVVDRVVPARPDTARRDTAARDTAAARRAAARDADARRIVYVVFAPGAADRLPTARSILVVHGTGREAQRAAARILAGGGGDEREDDAPAPMRGAWPPARRLERAPAREAGMSADSLERIDRVLRKALEDGVFTGAVVAVGRHGKLVKLTGYGRTSGRPIDPAATMFDIASLSKVVGTTAAVMALVDDGRIRLDAPVRRYLPQFRGGSKGDVTVRHLLTHTSGLPAGSDLYGDARSPEGALRRVYRTDLVAKPGEKVIYSDFGMILLAEIVRRRAEEPMDRFLARRVFVPLGMAGTMYEPPVFLQDRIVPTAARSERPFVLDGVVHDANAFRLGGVAGHAGLFSTATDLAVYAQTWLNGGAYGASRIWSASTVRAFTARQQGAGTRALGWDTPAPVSSASDYLSSTSYGHTGYTGTSIWIDPLRDMFVVLLTNRTYDGGTSAQILTTRRAVAEAAVLSITEFKVSPRPNTPAWQRQEAAKRKPKPRPRRPTRPRGRGRG